MSGFEVDDFARLERHDGHQILCRIEAEEDSEGSYGPRVITRCDYGVTIETRGAVFPDTEEGYAAAARVMAELDLAAWFEQAKMSVLQLVGD